MGRGQKNVVINLESIQWTLSPDLSEQATGRDLRSLLTMSPVLWPIYFKVDGSTVQLTDAGTLNGSATITGTAGSLGNLGVTAFAPLDPNLGGLADTTYWIAIPQVIGQWSDQVIPILVPPSLQPLLGPDQPAIFGAVAVLMKAGAVEEDALEAGHAALNSGVQAALDTLISNIGPGHPDITQADIDAIVPGVQSQVQQAIEGAMDTPDKISAYFNPAQFIGDAIVHFSQDDFPDPGDNTPFSPTFQFFGPIEIDGSVSVLSPCVAQAVTARMADPPADALAAMREFRDGGGLARQPGLQAWWALASSQSGEIGHLAVRHEELGKSARAVLAAMPGLLGDGSAKVPDAVLEDLAVVLDTIARHGSGTVRGKALAAMLMLPRLRGRSASEAMEILASQLPQAHV